jgi:multiple sugar transport system permease protein
MDTRVDQSKGGARRMTAQWKTQNRGLASLKHRLLLERAGSVMWGLVRGILIMGISYVILLPLLTKISASFMLERDLFDQTIKWIPKRITLDNYRSAFENMQYPRAFLNSALLATSVALIQTFSCAMVGYGFARFRFKASGMLFAMVLFTIVVPPQMVFIPQYLNFRFFDVYGLLKNGGVNLVGTVWPLIATSLTCTGLKNGLFIYIFRQSFRGMPKELEEAAYVDGASRLRTFYGVMMRGATPALVTVFLFAFVWQWNDDFFTTVFLRSATILPVTLSQLGYTVTLRTGIAGMTSQYASLIINTGSLLFILPLLILYAFMQRFFIESVERSGLVG